MNLCTHRIYHYIIAKVSDKLQGSQDTRDHSNCFLYCPVEVLSKRDIGVGRNRSILEHESIVDNAPGRSVTMVQSHPLSARELVGETIEPMSNSYIERSQYEFVCLTKGNDKVTIGSEINCDAKTVCTDFESTSDNSHQYQQQTMQQEFTQYSELDWSFLQEGELFDRKDQQQRLLDAFHRQIVTENATERHNVDNNNNDDTHSGYTNKKGDQRLQSFRSCTFRASSKEFVVVSGLSGTGKTILVEETLKGLVEERGGYFLCGKLDQLNKSKSSPQRPYAPFVMAFSSLVDSVLTNHDDTEDIRAKVCSKMTNRDIDLIVETFPSLARLLSRERNGMDCVISKNKINSPDNQTQLARVVRIFLETICDPQKRPIVLLIDDLQWADQGTLVLLNALLSEIEDDRNTVTNGLLLVGTCRHNEVTVEDELAELLRTLEDEANVIICQIEVTNLSRPVCGELFARVLGVPRENYSLELASSLEPLVDIAYEQTKGNAFFLLQFIRSLHDEGYLQVQTQEVSSQKHAPAESISKIAIDDVTCNSSITALSDQSRPHQALRKPEYEKRQSVNWLWSEEAIRKSGLHDAARTKQDAVSMITHQMKRLPPQVQETLLVASCLGSEFDKRMLHMAMPIPSAENYMSSPELLFSSLELLIEKHFLKSIARPGYYKFRHDKIQQAAIALIHDNERALFCTNIGRRVLERSGSSKSENIFLIVNFFSHGISEGIITDRSERMVVAALAMEAGEAATVMSDFTTAATYFSLGISCLQSNYIGIRYGYWKDEYDFSLAIFSAAAEVEKCVANFGRMERLIREILQNARQFYDKMRAYTTMIQSLGIRERLLEAIAQGLSLLEVVGEPFHTKDLKIFLLFDLIKTKRMLRKFDGDLDRSPAMKDKDKLAAMEILNLIFPYLSMLKHPKAPLAIFRMVQLSVNYGITANSATGFAAYGMGLCGLGDFVNGNRYGKIALRILDQFKARQLTCRVHCIYYGFVSNWNRVSE